MTLDRDRVGRPETFMSKLWLPGAEFIGDKAKVIPYRTPEEEKPCVEDLHMGFSSETILPGRSGIDFGQQIQFDYNFRRNQVVEEVYLVLTLAQLAAAGGGNQPRYADDIALAGLEWYRIIVGGKTLKEFEDTDIIRWLEDKDEEEDEIVRIRRDRAGDLTIVERAARATAQQTVRIKLPLFVLWNSKDEAEYNHMKAWHIYMSNAPIRFEFKLRPLDVILQQTAVNARPTPVASTTYIIDAYLKLLCGVVTDNQVLEYKNVLQTSKIIHHWPLFTMEVFNIPAGTTGVYPVQLRTCTKPVYMIFIVYRRQANLLSDYTNNRRFPLDIGPDFGEFKCGTDSLTGRFSRDDLIERFNRNYFAGDRNNYIWAWHWGKIPSEHEGIPLNINWPMLPNPTYESTFNAPTGVELEMRFYYFSPGGMVNTWDSTLGAAIYYGFGEGWS